MRKLLTLAAVAGLAATGVIAATGGAQTAQPRTLTLFENVAHETSALVDNPPRSPARDPGRPRFRLSVGDEVVATTPLLGRRGGSRIGTSYASVTVVKGRIFERATLEGDVVLALRDGTVALSGLVGAAQRPLAVVGGTGAYEGARGSATEKEIGNGAELTIRLLP
jgi:hypothetical protein